MKCSKCRKLMVEFSEERLEDELDREMREHIAECPACWQELDEFQASLELMDNAINLVEVPAPPVDFAEQMMDRIRQNAKFRFSFRKLTFGVATVCCLLMLGASLLFHDRFSERQGTPPAPNSATFVEIKPEVPKATNNVTHRATQPGGDDSRIVPTIHASKMPTPPAVDTVPSRHAKEQIGMELVRFLEQTLEIIERGEQEWEVEI